MNLETAKAEIEEKRTAASRAKVGKKQANTQVLVEDALLAETPIGNLDWPTWGAVVEHLRASTSNYICILATATKIPKPKVVRGQLDLETLEPYSGFTAFGVLLLGFEQTLHSSEICGPF